MQTQDEILHPTPLPGAAACCWRGKSTPLGPQAWCHCAVEALLHLPKETTRSPGAHPHTLCAEYCAQLTPVLSAGGSSMQPWQEQTGIFQLMQPPQSTSCSAHS